MKIMLQLSKHQNKYIDLCSTDNATSKEKHRRCASPLLHISYLEHTTNDWVQSKINFLVDPQEPLLATIKRRKLAWFEHNTCHDSLSKPIFQGTLEGRRRRGWLRKYWIDNIKRRASLPMPELLTRAFWRTDLEEDLCRIVLTSPPALLPGTTQSVMGLNLEQYLNRLCTKTISVQY